jgi:hypothetical protein
MSNGPMGRRRRNSILGPRMVSCGIPIRERHFMPVDSEMKMRIAILAEDDHTCKGHCETHNDIDDSVNVMREEQWRQSQGGEFRDEHTLDGKGRKTTQQVIYNITSRFSILHRLIKAL